MRAYIKHGKLPSFISIKHDADRVKQLTFEIPHIQKQLDDPTRVLLAENTAAYEQWTSRAQHSLKLFQEEKRLREARIKDELLRQAYKLLLALEVKVDLDDASNELMEQLDDYFGVPNEKQQTA